MGAVRKGFSEMFSVVIPVYNCEKTILGAIKSVCSQSRYDLIKDLIIVNDGSTDRTSFIISDYIKQHAEKKIVYVEQHNHGVSHARNVGIKIAQGEWIALLDGDDEWTSDKIERQYEIIKSHSNICFLGAIAPLKIIREKKGLYKLSAKELCFRNMPNTSSVVFKRTVGIELGLFDEKRKHVEDIQFFQKFLLKDSYYVLAEDLTRINVDKHFVAEKGLSSNLFLMYKGRNQNTYNLYKMGLISRPYLILMLGMNWLKYLRRSFLRMLAKVKYRV